MNTMLGRRTSWLLCSASRASRRSLATFKDPDLDLIPNTRASKGLRISPTIQTDFYRGDVSTSLTSRIQLALAFHEGYLVPTQFITPQERSSDATREIEAVIWQFVMDEKYEEALKEYKSKGKALSPKLAVLMLIVYGNLRLPNEAMLLPGLAKDAGWEFKANEYNALVQCLASCHQVQAAHFTLEKMESRRIPISEATWLHVMQMHASAGSPLAVRKVFDRAAQMYTPSISSHVALMAAYRKLRDYDNVLQIFKTIKEEHKSAAYRNETGWVLAIEAALKTQNSEAASSIMRDSEDLGIQPTIQLFDALLSHFASTDKVELIEQTLAQMASAGISPSIISTSLTQDIFRAYYKAGRLEEARSMLNKYNPHHHAGPAYLALLGEYCTNIALFTQEFRRLVEESKDGESIPALYSEAIAVLMRHHMVEEAKFLLEEMETQGITPNAPQCAVILKTMIDADAIVKAEDYLKRWRPPPSSPYRETPYLVLVEEYCKQGHEERAMSLINEMQHQHRIAATAPFFHALMQANFAKNKGDNVPALLRRMTSPSSVRPALSPTRDTLRVVVSGFSELRDAAHLTEWWRNLTTHHFVEPERPEWLAYIVGLVKCGEYDLAIAAWSDLLFKVGIDRAGCDLILNTLIEEQLMSATTMKDVKGLLSDKNFTKSTTNSILTAAPAADLGRRFAAWMKNAKRRKIAFAR